MSTEAILSTARQFLDVDPSVPITIVPITKGASERTIARVKSPVHEDFIGIHWTEEREDNDQYVPVAQFLKKARLRVPEILHDRSRHRVALVQDLGDQDLLSMKGEPFEKRLPIYRSAFEQIDRLFFARVPEDLELMPPFDAELYRWEQEYFFEYLVEGLLGQDADGLRGNEAFSTLAEGLGKVARHLVHRDFQSQNILVHDGQAWLIDFQGLRRGRQEYDLASLIFDPYMDHSAEEREQLLDLWEDVSDERPEIRLFHECAAQRLMQAMGAYGKILTNGGDEWYRQHVSTAARLLGEVTKDTELEEPLAEILEAAQSC
ncbi:MAG: phosphotransferase [Akkermansiaceae bacterium]|nr:phosphotransferase [Akkermansiaceae bacterium]